VAESLAQVTAMDEPALYNGTRFHVSVLPILDRDGAHSRVVIVKATYDLARGEPLQLAEEQREPRLGDEMWGSPEIADVRLPGDFCASKPGTDFVLSSHAIAPDASGSATFVDVAIQVADRARTLRVHGARNWRSSLMGVVPGPSAAMVPTPLAWSRAYGGVDLSDPRHPLEEARNPAGTGVVRDSKLLIGTPAPQIEAVDEPIGNAGTRMAPAGCAALAPNYEPRRSKAGTYDSRWLRDGYPARPADYDPAHENCAAPGWHFDKPLRGGELVRLSGVSAMGRLEFSLPKLAVLVEAEIDGQLTERRPHLDTVVVDGDALVLEFAWRGLFRCPTKMRHRFTAIRVRAKEFVG